MFLDCCCSLTYPLVTEDHLLTSHDSAPAFWALKYHSVVMHLPACVYRHRSQQGGTDQFRQFEEKMPPESAGIAEACRCGIVATNCKTLGIQRVSCRPLWLRVFTEQVVKSGNEDTAQDMSSWQLGQTSFPCNDMC